MYSFQSNRIRRLLVTITCAICLCGGMESMAAEVVDPMKVDLAASNADEQLVQIIRDTTNTTYRFQAVVQLISMDETAKSHREVLIKVMKSNPNARLRAYVATNLHKLLDAKTGVPLLIESLWDRGAFSRCSNVADSVAGGIASYGESARFAVPMIQKAMETKGPDGLLVATDLHRVLGAIDPMQFPFFAYGEASVMPLAKVLDSDDPALRRQAILRLYALSDIAKPAIPAVETMLNDADDYVQVMAASMLLRFATNDQAATVIAKIADNEESENRLLALKQIGLGHNRVPMGQMVLQRATSDAEEEVRKTAYLSLNSVPTLVKALDDASPLVVEAAVKQLARFGGQARPAVDPLRSLLKAENDMVRVESVIALRYITGRPEALPVLIEALKSADYRAKSRALREMKYFPAADLVPAGDALVVTLASDEKALPYLASNTLRYMESHARPLLPQLRELSNHSSSKVKSGANAVIRRLEESSQLAR
jgi:hypothetical protein